MGACQSYLILLLRFSSVHQLGVIGGSRYSSFMPSQMIQPIKLIMIQRPPDPVLVVSAIPGPSTTRIHSHPLPSPAFHWSSGTMSAASVHL